MSRRKALITGITGQDGSYLAEFLLTRNYDVHGIVRSSVLEGDRYSRVAHILDKITLHEASLEDFSNISRVVKGLRPDECFHLGAQTVVAHSDEFSTVRSNITGTHHMLAVIREHAPGCRFCFAGSSEMFGRAEEFPQSEATPFHPRSVYGVSKVAGFDLTRTFRENRDMFAATAILFNHESPRRGHQFVTRKITSTVAQILAGKTDHLALGRLDARRDWGHARDYIRAMWLMLQQDEPRDYVIATGSTHTVGHFVDLAFSTAGLDPERYVRQDPRFVRPPEEFVLAGDSARARAELGWKPEISFEDLVTEMVEFDCRAAGVEIQSEQTRAVGPHAG